MSTFKLFLSQIYSNFDYMIYKHGKKIWNTDETLFLSFSILSYLHFVNNN